MVDNCGTNNHNGVQNARKLSLRPKKTPPCLKDKAAVPKTPTIALEKELNAGKLSLCPKELPSCLKDKAAVAKTPTITLEKELAAIEEAGVTKTPRITLEKEPAAIEEVKMLDTVAKKPAIQEGKKSCDKNKKDKEQKKKSQLSPKQLDKAIKKKIETKHRHDLKKARQEARKTKKPAPNPLIPRFSAKTLMKTASGQNVYEWLCQIQTKANPLPREVLSLMESLSAASIIEAKPWRKLAVKVINIHFPNFDIETETKKPTIVFHESMFNA